LFTSSFLEGLEQVSELKLRFGGITTLIPLVKENNQNQKLIFVPKKSLSSIMQSEIFQSNSFFMNYFQVVEDSKDALILLRKNLH
jgi:hypothetical protein